MFVEQPRLHWVCEWWLRKQKWGDTFIAATPTLATSHSWTPSLQYRICVILLNQYFVPVFHCPSVSLFHCFFVPVFHCLSVSLFQCFFFPVFHCTSVSLFQCYFVPVFHCPSVSLFQSFFVPLFPCAILTLLHQSRPGLLCQLWLLQACTPEHTGLSNKWRE